MASVVQIYNLALGNIGQSQTVAATDEQSKPARVCTQFYEQCRDELLAEVEWPFATAWKALSSLAAGSPTDDWEYAYDYPSDCLKARFIVTGNRREHPYDKTPFEIASQSSGTRKMILSDTTTPTLCYTKRIEDPQSFPPLFVSALAAYLAYRIAMPMNADPKRRNAAFEQYQIDVARATGQELDEGVPDEPAQGEFVAERLS